MLPKKYRLILPFKPKSGTQQLRKQTKHFYLVAFSKKRLNCTKPTRFAIRVSKKIDKRATRRNRTRRLISEALWQLIPRVKQGYDGIITVRRVFWHEKLETVCLYVESLLKQANLLEKTQNRN